MLLAGRGQKSVFIAFQHYSTLLGTVSEYINIKGRIAKHQSQNPSVTRDFFKMYEEFFLKKGVPPSPLNKQKFNKLIAENKYK